MKWVITRQAYWPDGRLMVEIAAGGLDYCNADALSARYTHLGEFKEFNDPREAVEAAIKIADAWRKTKPGKRVSIGHGHTGGFTMPFEGCTVKDARAWAEETWEKLPKCDWCGEPLPDKRHQYTNDFGDKFCREHCAERSWEENERLNAEEESPDDHSADEKGEEA